MQKMTNKQRAWQKRIEDWSTSGLSQADYCRRQGIQPKRFYSWKNRLERMHCNPVTTTTITGSFLPVALVDPASEQIASPIVLCVNGVKIQYARDTDETLLLKVVSLLEARA